MLQRKEYTCVRCGRAFTKTVGGIVMTPDQMRLELNPICDLCKIKKVVDILNPQK